MVLMVKVEGPDPVTELGLKLELVLLGSPLRLKLTTPLNPPELVTDTLKVVLDPRVTVRDEGVAAMLKSPAAGALTVSETLVVCEMLPSSPVIVIV